MLQLPIFCRLSGAVSVFPRQAKGFKTMRSQNWSFVAIALVWMSILFGCNLTKKTPSANTNNTNETEVTGVEKVKPAPGTGNVQGKVFYNSKPAEGIEVKLCESFNRFLGGCSGKEFTAKTDKDGDYVITNVPPKTYDTILARVFDTDSSIFATSGIAGISATKYEVVADKTLFVNTTHLFKSDLKLTHPKAAEKVSATGLELRWESYPDAAYYKLSVRPNDHMVTSPYTNKRVDGTSFTLDQPLQKGTYRWQVGPNNSANRNLPGVA